MNRSREELEKILGQHIDLSRIGKHSKDSTCPYAIYATESCVLLDDLMAWATGKKEPWCPHVVWDDTLTTKWRIREASICEYIHYCPICGTKRPE